LTYVPFGDEFGNRFDPAPGPVADRVERIAVDSRDKKAREVFRGRRVSLGRDVGHDRLSDRLAEKVK
jgi:hypothetical protein